VNNKFLIPTTNKESFATTPAAKWTYIICGKIVPKYALVSEHLEKHKQTGGTKN
jgi:hypothetical protein